MCKIKCKICKKKFKSITNTHLKNKHNLSVNEYKNKFPKAPIVSKNTSKKLSKISKERFNTLNKDEIKKIVNQIKKTKKERYGDENYNNYEQCCKTKEKKYGNRNYNNVKKYKKTNLLKYGKEHFLQTEEGKEKFTSTMLNKYEVKWPSQNEEIVSKIIKTKSKKSKKEKNKIELKKQKTFLKTYGVTHYFKAKDENGERLIVKDFENKYGVKFASQVKEFKDKSRIKRSQTMSQKISNGEFHPHGHHKKGYYISKITGNKERYDSSWELIKMKNLDKQKVYWTKLHNIVIPYFIKGIKHHYVPDFLIEDRIVEEIKPKELALNQKIKLKSGLKFCKYNNYIFKMICFKNDLDRSYKIKF